MKNLFLPINLETEYRNVLDYAIAIADKSHAHVDIMYASGAWLKWGTFTYESENTSELIGFLKKFPEDKRGRVLSIIRLLEAKQLSFTFTLTYANPLKAILQQVQKHTYEWAVMGTRDRANTGIIRGPFVNKVVEQLHIPALIVPETLPFNDIHHITYAVDLMEYDASVIERVKSMAKMFDAKLSIVHVNPATETQSAQYASILECTINATLDYPKVVYKFFDYNDIFSGIEHFVSLNNTHLLAMINRHSFSTKKENTSLTQRAMKDLGVPLLAFKK